MRRGIWITIGIVLVAIAAALFVTQTRKEPGVIKIGAAMPLTGEGAVYGVPQKNAAELAAKDLNKKGGLLGKKIIIIAEDDKALPAEAANIAHMFASMGDIVGVIGHPNSGNAIPASKIYHQYNIPYIVTSATNPLITQQGFKNVFRFCPTDNMQGISIAEFIFNRLKVHKIVIIHDNEAYGSGLAIQVRRNFEKLGGKVLLFDAIMAGDKDYRGILEKAYKYNPKVIFYGGMLREAAILIRQAKELGFNCKFVFGDGAFNERLRKLAGTDCRNVYISFLAPPWEKVPTAKKFVQEFKKLYGSVPPFAPYGYDAVLVLAEAIKRAKSTNRERIIQALHDPSFVVKGVTGTIRFDEHGQTQGRRFYFYTFSEKGKLVLFE